LLKLPFVILPQQVGMNFYVDQLMLNQLDQVLLAYPQCHLRDHILFKQIQKNLLLPSGYTHLPIFEQFSFILKRG